MEENTTHSGGSDSVADSKLTQESQIGDTKDGFQDGNDGGKCLIADGDLYSPIVAEANAIDDLDDDENDNLDVCQFLRESTSVKSLEADIDYGSGGGGGTVANVESDSDRDGQNWTSGTSLTAATTWSSSPSSFSLPSSSSPPSYKKKDYLHGPSHLGAQFSHGMISELIRRRDIEALHRRRRPRRRYRSLSPNLATTADAVETALLRGSGGTGWHIKTVSSHFKCVPFSQMMREVKNQVVPAATKEEKKEMNTVSAPASNLDAKERQFLERFCQGCRPILEQSLVQGELNCADSDAGSETDDDDEDDDEEQDDSSGSETVNDHQHGHHHHHGQRHDGNPCNCLFGTMVERFPWLAAIMAHIDALPTVPHAKFILFNVGLMVATIEIAKRISRTFGSIWNGVGSCSNGPAAAIPGVGGANNDEFDLEDDFMET